MDIVMLGHSKAGKTSFMAAMYESVTHGVGGFSLSAERPEEHRVLLRNARQLRNGHYPPWSDHRSVYRLNLVHDDVPVMAFSWRDYRGGALTEGSRSLQAAELRADVAAATGLVLVIDSTELTGGPRALARIRPLVAMATGAASARSDTLALVIALTKWDLVRPAQARSAANRALGSLISAVRGSRHVHGALIPVACGRQPLNVVQPALWCLYVGLAIRASSLRRSVEELQETARLARSRDTRWDRFKTFFTGEPAWNQIADGALRSARAEAELLHPLIVPGQRLETLLDPIEKF
jgi:hypothetical protein